jgi:hypothetical protein
MPIVLSFKPYYLTLTCVFKDDSDDDDDDDNDVEDDNVNHGLYIIPDSQNGNNKRQAARSTHLCWSSSALRPCSAASVIWVLKANQCPNYIASVRCCDRVVRRYYSMLLYHYYVVVVKCCRAM